MSLSNDAEPQGTSTRPYLIRALHDWCTDNGFTPYLAVYVDTAVQVPREYVKNNEIVLNVSFDATSHLKLGNEVIEFTARFGGVARNIVVPVDHVIAVYARENGQGMAFPVPSSLESDESSNDDAPEGASPAASGKAAIRLAPAASPEAHVTTEDLLTAHEPSGQGADGEDPAPEPPPTTPSGSKRQKGARPSLRRIK